MLDGVAEGDAGPESSRTVAPSMSFSSEAISAMSFAFKPESSNSACCKGMSSKSQNAKERCEYWNHFVSMPLDSLVEGGHGNLLHSGFWRAT